MLSAAPVASQAAPVSTPAAPLAPLAVNDSHRRRSPSPPAPVRAAGFIHPSRAALTGTVPLVTVPITSGLPSTTTPGDETPSLPLSSPLTTTVLPASASSQAPPTPQLQPPPQLSASTSASSVGGGSAAFRRERERVERVLARLISTAEAEAGPRAAGTLFKTQWDDVSLLLPYSPSSLTRARAQHSSTSSR